MTCKIISDENESIRILDCETNNVFSLENKEEALKFCDALNVTLDYVNELIEAKVELKKENEQLKKQIEKIDFILDDLNGAEYISRDDGIKALNKIDKVIGKR